jgi:hypothetical protein
MKVDSPLRTCAWIVTAMLFALPAHAAEDFIGTVTGVADGSKPPWPPSIGLGLPRHPSSNVNYFDAEFFHAFPICHQRPHVERISRTRTDVACTGWPTVGGINDVSFSILCGNFDLSTSGNSAVVS